MGEKFLKKRLRLFPLTVDPMLEGLCRPEKQTIEVVPFEKVAEKYGGVSIHFTMNHWTDACTVLHIQKTILLASYCSCCF